MLRRSNLTVACRTGRRSGHLFPNICTFRLVFSTENKNLSLHYLAFHQSWTQKNSYKGKCVREIRDEVMERSGFPGPLCTLCLVPECEARVGLYSLSLTTYRCRTEYSVSRLTDPIFLNAISGQVCRLGLSSVGR